MWEKYVCDAHHLPTISDRERLEEFIRGKLPDEYWKLVCEHQGDTFDGSITLPEQGELDFGVLLLVTSPDDEKENYSYCVETCLSNMRGYYPDGILPFADDAGGNYWAFDFRESSNVPAIVFIDHEVAGEEGVVHVSETFGSFMAELLK